MPAISLPVEIWEMIISHLDRKTHLLLRLTNKQVSRLGSGSTFRRAIEDQTIELNSQSLRSFYALSIHPEYGPLVKDVSVVIPPRLRSAGEDEELVLPLLGACFKSLGRLRCIRLRMKANSLADRYNQQKTAQAYLVKLLAATKADIAISHLDLIEIPLKITNVLDLFNLLDASKFTTSLKCLSLCLNVNDLKDGQEGSEDHDTRTLHHVHTICSGIETLILDVHGTEDIDPERERILHKAVGCHFPKLQKLHLSISFLDAEILIAFLNHHPDIVDLALDELIYTSSDWEQVCLTIQAAMPCLTRLGLGEETQIKESYYNLAPMWDAGNGSGRREFNRQELQSGFFISEVRRVVGIVSSSGKLLH